MVQKPTGDRRPLLERLLCASRPAAEAGGRGLTAAGRAPEGRAQSPGAPRVPQPTPQRISARPVATDPFPTSGLSAAQTGSAAAGGGAEGSERRGGASFPPFPGCPPQPIVASGGGRPPTRRQGLAPRSRLRGRGCPWGAASALAPEVLRTRVGVGPLAPSGGRLRSGGAAALGAGPAA